MEVYRYEPPRLTTNGIWNLAAPRFTPTDARLYLTVSILEHLYLGLVHYVSLFDGI